MDFACKEIDVTQVLSCAFGLSKSGCAVMKNVLKSKQAQTSEDLAQSTGYDLATVQRALKHLSERGVVRRMQQNRAQGGYEFVYSPVSKAEFIALVDKTLATWLSQAHQEVLTWSAQLP